MSGQAVLQCRDLSVTFQADDGEIRAVDGLNMQLEAGECLGVVGESGSGKSQSFLAMLGLLAPNGQATGSVLFQGEEILNASRSRLNALRGGQAAMIFQDALSGLTPTMRIGEQLMEMAREHLGASRREARARALEVLESVRIPDAETRMQAYPFELSGGMRQRVMIAMALMCRPRLVIADEPTTALDVTVQAQILRLLTGLKRHGDNAMILITHDLAVVAGICDRVMILYAGQVMEVAPVSRLFSEPAHPYTQGLLQSIPRLDDQRDQPLPTIPGQPPDLSRVLEGCPFADRCRHVMRRCYSERPVLEDIGNGHARACHLEQPA